MKTHAGEDEWARGILRNPSESLARKVAAHRTIARRKLDTVTECPDAARRWHQETTGDGSGSRRDLYLRQHPMEPVAPSPSPEPLQLPKPAWWRRWLCGSIYVLRDRQWRT